MATLQDVETSRTDYASATSQAEFLRGEAFTLRRVYQEKSRSLGAIHPDTIQAQQAWQAAESDYAQGRADRETYWQQFESTRAGYLNAVIPGDEATLLDPSVPVALFPVRIETRFDHAASELKVRIYPDEILAESHEPALTDAEWSAGLNFWTTRWNASMETIYAAWRRLLTGHQPGRAGWIVEQTRPTNYLSMAIQPPSFPPRGTVRTSSWSTSTRAKLLPDRWAVMAYRGGIRTHLQFSSLVPEPLALTISPDPTASKVALDGTDLEVSEESAWAYDYQRALTAGMAVTLPLSAQDLVAGFDRILVVGIKASLSTASASNTVEALLDGHRRARGFELLAQGTPTNNTSESASGLRVPTPEDSYALEVDGQQPIAERDGARLTSALGISTDCMVNIRGANRDEQGPARKLQRILWRATVGYFLEQMMDPLLTQQEIENVRDFYVDHVRGRGHFSSFRVGRVPYGILPVSSLGRWSPAGTASFTRAGLPDLLRDSKQYWTQAVPSIPRVGRSLDPDADLLEAMSLDASSKEARVRQVFGPGLLWNLFGFMGLDSRGWWEAQRTFSNDVLDTLGHRNWDARILGVTFGRQAFLWNRPLVVAEPPSETEGLKLISDMRELTPFQLRTFIPDEPSLFFVFLRQALLLEFERAVAEFHVQAGIIPGVIHREPELVGMSEEAIQRGTMWDNMAMNVNGIVPGTSQLLLINPTNSAALDEIGVAMEEVSATSIAEIERLFSEILDVSSHRWDAWALALYHDRLEQMRVSQPDGLNVGAFGWAEDVRPKPLPTSTVTLPDGRTATIAQESGGYVHAPSLSQAATAAILRNAYVTRQGEGQERFALQLTSKRVRQAAALMDTVRQGQSVGAALGYLLERALHDQGRDDFIEPLRQRFPMVADKATGVVDNAVSKAARGVVDGLAARLAWNADHLAFWQHPLLSATDAARRPVVEALLDEVNETVDAAADVLSAEAVHQIVRGNATGASATFDALAKGVRPPEPDFVRTPRTGASYLHKVVFALPEVAAGQQAPPASWPTTLTQRALAQPALNQWAAAMLGNPSATYCEVFYSLPNDPATYSQRISLHSINAQPLDVVAWASPGFGAGLPEEVRLRIAEVHLAAVPNSVVDHIEAVPQVLNRQSEQSFSEVLELARAIGNALSGARTLSPDDLALPETQGAELAAPVATAATLGRANDAASNLSAGIMSLNTAIAQYEAAPDAVKLDAVRAELRKAVEFGINGAYPRSHTGATAELANELLNQAWATLAEMQRRNMDGGNASEPSAKARAVFGKSIPFLVGFTPSSTAELSAAHTARSSIGVTSAAVSKWFEQAAQVRAPLKRWRHLSLYSRVKTGSSLGFDVAQLPNDGAPWVALPWSSPPSAGRLSLALHLPSGLPVGDWHGLVLDEWTELAPGREEITGVAFNYDDSGAEAAHTILLLVPPVMGIPWSLDAMADVLQETLELAKVRAVDGELLEPLAQFRPALFVPSIHEETDLGLQLKNYFFKETA